MIKPNNSEENTILTEDTGGNKYHPFWISEDDTKKFIKGKWKNNVPESIGLTVFMNIWLPSMIDDNRKAMLYSPPAFKKMTFQ